MGGRFYRHKTNLTVVNLLLDCMQISGNLWTENTICDQLIGGLNDPCLAIPLHNPLLRDTLQVSMLAIPQIVIGCCLWDVDGYGGGLTL